MSEQILGTGNFTKRRAKAQTFWGRTAEQLRLFYSHPLNTISFIVVVLMVLMALFAPLIAPYDFAEVNTAEQWQGPSAKHWR